jgi:intein/homing endonuclease
VKETYQFVGRDAIKANSWIYQKSLDLPSTKFPPPDVPLNIFAPQHDDSGCGYLRIIVPLKHLRAAGLANVAMRQDFMKEATEIDFPEWSKAFDWANVVILQREHRQEAPIEMIKEFNDSNKAVIFEVDDHVHSISDVWPTLPEDSPVRAWTPETISRLEQWAIGCDALTVSTEGLKEFWESKGAEPVYYIPNQIDNLNLRWNVNIPDNGNKIVIGYMGSYTHGLDMLAAKEAIKRVLNRYKNVCMRFIAWMPDWVGELPQGQLEGTNLWSPMDSYPVLMSGIDIGIFPLEDNEFNRLGKCLTGDTLVATPTGIKRIDSIQTTVGTRYGWKDAIRHENGSHKILQIETEKGFRIKTTKNHRLMGKGEFRTVGEYVPGDWIDLEGLPFSQEYVRIKYSLFQSRWTCKGEREVDQSILSMSPEILIDENWGRFLGYFMGDGNATSTVVRISAYAGDEDVCADITNLFKSMGLVPHHREKKTPFGISKGITIEAASSLLLDLLAYLDIVSSRNGSKPHSRIRNLEVPDIIWRSPRSVAREFLRGLFESDGHHGKIGIEFSTKSERLAREVQLLLLGFGILSRVRYHLARCKGKSFDSWRLTISKRESFKFLQSIGFISRRKQGDAVPDIDENLDVTLQQAADILNTTRYLLSRKNIRKQCVGKNTFVSLSEASKVLGLPTHPGLMDRIISIEEIGTEETFDLTVPSTGEFLANGFISHNSDLKYLEYSLIGAPTIASKIGQISKSIKHRETGILIPHDDKEEERWEYWLCKLIENKKMRNRLLENAVNYVLHERSISCKLYNRYEIYRDIFLRRNTIFQERSRFLIPELAVNANMP